MNEFDIGREPLLIVEIEQPVCSLRYGVSPCKAILGKTGVQKCYNTFKTCQSHLSFNTDNIIYWRFCKPDANFTNAIPSVQSVSTTPTKINIGGGSETESPFGRRATCTITFADHPTDDSNDYYLNDRGFDPLTKGTFWGKFLARNPYYVQWKINIYEGYQGQSLQQMQKRSYIIDKIAGPSGGKVTITAKDILRIADDKRALAPNTSDSRLAVHITDTQATGIVIENSEDDILALKGNTSVYYLRIDDEILSYTGATKSDTLYTLAGVQRGQLGTEAAEHDVDENAQRVVAYENYPCWKVAYDLLVNFASIPSEYINMTDWDLEGNTWLNTFIVSGVIEEPKAVDELLGELCEQCLFYIWWDERAQKIKMRAVRPEIDTVYPMDDTSNIIKTSLSIREDPNQRASRVVIYFNRKNPTESEDKIANYANATLRVDVDSEFAYNEARTKRIYSRWLTTEAQAHQLSVRFIERYKWTPKYVTLKVDAKDRAINVSDVVMLDTNSIQDELGDNIVNIWQVISVNEVTHGETIQLELQSFEFEEGERYGFYTYPDALDYGDYTSSERRGKAFYADNDGLVAGDEPYLYS
ncbi:MAG: hypothetical protein LBI78_07365 [Campylobacteraceae bacterium]|jgi:hypothetical protein|nr:hypothetical protein [Campylobacteraceae bacterium]